MNDNDYRQYKDKLNELKSLLPEVAGLANSPKSDEEKIEVLERVQALVRDIANGIDNPEVLLLILCEGLCARGVCARGECVRVWVWGGVYICFLEPV